MIVHPSAPRRDPARLLRLLMVLPLLVVAIGVPARIARASGGAHPTALTGWDGGGTFYHLRSAPTTAAGVIATVRRGERVEILSGVSGEPLDGNRWWYRVRDGASEGYLSSSAILTLETGGRAWTAIVTNDGDLSTVAALAYRAPAQGDQVAARFGLGAHLTVLATASGEALDGANGSWYRVQEGALMPLFLYSRYLKFAHWGTTRLPAPLLTAASAIAIDEKTGRLLFALDAHRKRRPASTVKMMTALVALQHRSPYTTMRVPAGVATVTTDVGGSAMGIAPGQAFAMRDLLYGLLLPSGNDAAFTIAQSIGGSQARFVHLMNVEAAVLHLRDTHFTNAVGLDDPGEHTSAENLARLARYMLSHEPLFARIVRTRSYTVHASSDHPEIALQNLNRLLGAYPGADGVKTGTTPDAGENLVAAATRFHRRVIVVVLGASDRYADASALLDYAFTVAR